MRLLWSDFNDRGAVGHSIHRQIYLELRPDLACMHKLYIWKISYDKVEPW
jgi:hypothetical protein